MTQTLQGVLQQVAKIAGGGAAANTVGKWTGGGGITGVNAAWDRPPDSIQDDKTLVCFPQDGEFRSPHDEKFLMTLPHTFEVAFFLEKASASLEQQVGALLPYLERFQTAYAKKVTLNGACEEFWLASYRMGARVYAGTTYVALSFVCHAVTVDTSTIFAA